MSLRRGSKPVMATVENECSACRPQRLERSLEVIRGYITDASAFRPVLHRPCTPEGSCCELHAIADGFDGVQKTASKGIVWVITGLTGAPEDLAEAFSKIALPMVTTPDFGTIAKALRALADELCDNRHITSPEPPATP
ncbi:MAG TPA: hypothetical protein VFV67_02035 [Actinophytocola sp.]|uniref:hypothetical protein n=1 Tax=Actinophytocola sp. TaxID=1872138 RepID=UPI002DB8D7B4|nr:hypothetical protein [Actinophytocola sp.]HEU5469404.1 hypothetical protein [Actinophytocola sp.]